PEEVRNAAVILVTSNRGLAGAFNSNLIRTARNLLTELRAKGVQTELHILGKKGASFFRFLGEPIESSRTDLGDRPSSEDATMMVEPLTERFTNVSLDAVYVVHARFNSALSTPPTTA